MSAQHIATAAVVKVSIGSPSGNRVARLVRRGDVIPEGVAEEQLERLVARGLIGRVETDEPVEDVQIPEGAPTGEWTNKQIDAWGAKQQPPLQFASNANKTEKLEAVAKAAEQQTGA